MSSSARDARRLTPVEVATAGALSGLAVTFGLIAAVTPVFQLFFQVATAVPLAMVSLKLRPRAAVAAFASTILLAIAVGGFATAGRTFQAALVGLIIGFLHKKRASWLPVSGVAAGLGVIWGVGTGLAFWILSDLRTLGLESIRKTLDGILKLIGHIPHSGGFVDAGHHLGQWFVDWWWIWIPITRFIGVAFLVLSARWLLGAILSRISLDAGWDPLLDAAASSADPREGAEASSPLPLTLTDVDFTYPGADHPALRGVTLSFERPEFTVIVGHNGSGKSTLALLLAGAEPGSGTREGGGVLGAVGGTALVGQRSELLVLGQSVSEDVTWGMNAEHIAGLDLDELLERVGLAGLADADPRSLSGGQLQRLALAGALARSPRLLISDESTAMIDRAGRAEMLDLLASLPARGIAVVHITHDPADAEALGDAVWQMNRHGEAASLQAVSAPPVTPPAAEIRVNGIPLAEPHSLQLLAALAETPALTTVCQRLHIPVKRAQDTLDGLNNLAGAALTRCDGDKTHLTADGHAWLARVRTQAETFRQFLATHNINPTELLAMHFNISTRNQLKGTISAVQEGAVNSEIAISIGAHPLTAIITRASAERLGLKAGVEAYALIKASDVMIGSADIAAQISARNAIPGTISRIETGAVNDEVTLDIGDGNSLVAIITRTSAERLGFRVGQNACAIIKASNVMIGC